MSVPLVSVIMTVCNCERFVKEALESIFRQTFRDFEIIIYDDASTDTTWKVCVDTIKEYESKFMGAVRMIPGNRNVGCGEGRNRAIKRARGKYIAIQDGDDISFQNRLEIEVEFLEENDDIFCVGGWADKMEENGDFIEFMTYPPLDEREIFYEAMMQKNNPIIDPSCMYIREVFNELGGYDNKWKLVPDSNLWIRAMQAGCRFANLSDVLVHYRQHPNSVTNRREMDVVREQIRMCKELL